MGWLTGPAPLVKAVTAAHQFLIFTVPSAAQVAVAHGLQAESQFYEGLGPMLQAKRELLASQLPALGLEVLPAQGTYFLVADASSRLRPGEDDVAFCQRLTEEAGVTLIPVSAFYEDRWGSGFRLLLDAAAGVWCSIDQRWPARSGQDRRSLVAAGAAAGAGRQRPRRW